MDTISRELHQRVSEVWDVLRIAFRHMGERRSAEAAASMAFFSFFSLFPLLLVLVAVGSSIIESSQAQDLVLDLVLRVFPFSGETIKENIRKVLSVRSSVGLIGLAGLTWSATGAFSVLTRNINQAWPNTSPRNFLRIRLIAFGMLATLVGLLATLLVANPVMRLLPRVVSDAAAKAASLQFFDHFILWLSLFVTLVFLYYWIPTTSVRWSEITTSGFIWYLGSGLSNYNLVYGPLGAIVALLTWIYILSLIILFGAHFGAAIAQKSRELIS
jgi:membrane protein